MKVSDAEPGSPEFLFLLAASAVPPPPDPEEPPAAEEEEPFELPTLEEVARATGTLQSGTAGTFVCPPFTVFWF